MTDDLSRKTTKSDPHVMSDFVYVLLVVAVGIGIAHTDGLLTGLVFLVAANLGRIAVELGRLRREGIRSNA